MGLLMNIQVTPSPVKFRLSLHSTSNFIPDLIWEIQENRKWMDLVRVHVIIGWDLTSGFACVDTDPWWPLFTNRSWSYQEFNTIRTKPIYNTHKLNYSWFKKYLNHLKFCYLSHHCGYRTSIPERLSWSETSADSDVPDRQWSLVIRLWDWESPYLHNGGEDHQ